MELDCFASHQIGSFHLEGEEEEEDLCDDSNSANSIGDESVEDNSRLEDDEEDEDDLDDEEDEDDLDDEEDEEDLSEDTNSR